MASNSTSSSSATGGIGFCGALTIAFIVLKLCGVISWNWFWVLSPIIFSSVIGLIILIIILIIMTFGGSSYRRWM